MRKKPALQHILSGTYRKDRHGKQGVTFTAGVSMPNYLSPVARREWKRIAPELEQQGILTEVSQACLASYVSAYALWREALEDISKKGATIMCESTTRTGKTVVPRQNPAVKNLLQLQAAMLASAKLFGIDPLSRPRIEPQAPPPPAPVDDGWGDYEN